MADGTELTIENTRPSSEDVEKGDEHGVIKHRTCQAVEGGHKCGRPASMTCANCGIAICEYHTKRGRFCSEECFQAARLSGWGEKKVEKECKQCMSAVQIGGILIVIIVLIVGALAYFGILDPDIILAMVPPAITDMLPLP